ncbi:hypothetical protein JCM10450v2_005052 [Rhodotorula kratochvilovae]
MISAVPSSSIKTASGLSKGSTQFPPSSTPTKTKVDSPLVLKPMDATATKQFNKFAGDAAKFYTPATVGTIGGIDGPKLVELLQAKKLKIKMVDVRDPGDSDASTDTNKHRRFANSIFNPIRGGDFPPNMIPDGFKKLLGDKDFAAVRNADLVVIYCSQGSTRSPAIVGLYAKWRYANRTLVNPDQRIALLNGGFEWFCDKQPGQNFNGLITDVFPPQ